MSDQRAIFLCGSGQRYVPSYVGDTDHPGIVQHALAVNRELLFQTRNQARTPTQSPAPTTAGGSK
jgi:hypothetical protein